MKHLIERTPFTRSNFDLANLVAKLQCVHWNDIVSDETGYDDKPILKYQTYLVQKYVDLYIEVEDETQLVILKLKYGHLWQHK